MLAYEREARRIKHDPGDSPAEPQLPRLSVGDVSTEALTPLLAANPRGLLVVRDELAGWLRGMDEHHAGRGGDRQWWLSAWSGVPVEVDRVGRGHVQAPHPYVSVVGGTVPPRVADPTTACRTGRHGAARMSGHRPPGPRTACPPGPRTSGRPCAATAPIRSR